jgi:hypothetical protein
VGKRSFVQALSNCTLRATNVTPSSSNAMLGKTSRGGARATSILTGGCIVNNPSGISSGGKRGTAGAGLRSKISRLHLIVTAVPYDSTQAWLYQHGDSCDVAVLLYDENSRDSFGIAHTLEGYLPEAIPRVYIGNKADGSASGPLALVPVTVHDSDDVDSVPALANTYLAQNGLLPSIRICIQDALSITAATSTIAQVLGNPDQALPLAFRKKRRQSWLITWLTRGAICVVSLGVTSGIVVLTTSQQARDDAKSWLQRLTANSRALMLQYFSSTKPL